MRHVLFVFHKWLCALWEMFWGHSWGNVLQERPSGKFLHKWIQMGRLTKLMKDICGLSCVVGYNSSASMNITFDRNIINLHKCWMKVMQLKTIMKLIFGLPKSTQQKTKQAKKCNKSNCIKISWTADHMDMINFSAVQLILLKLKEVECSVKYLRSVVVSIRATNGTRGRYGASFTVTPAAV